MIGVKYPNSNKLIRNLILISLVPLVLFSLAYFVKFGYCLKYPISSNQADWGTFGDFLGGVLNPIYAFLAFVGVIYTVLLQKDQIEIMKTQQKLEELQQLITGLSETIDKVLYEQKYEYRTSVTPVFTLLRAISNDSIRIELDPADPISYVYRDTRTSVVELISFDLTYVEEQLSLMVWCLQTYEKNNGSNDIMEFYQSKYRNIAFMMKQIDHSQLREVQDFFEVEQVKKMVFEAVKANEPEKYGKSKGAGN